MAGNNTSVVVVGIRRVALIVGVLIGIACCIDSRGAADT